jgi:hypothetical protein
MSYHVHHNNDKKAGKAIEILGIVILIGLVALASLRFAGGVHLVDAQEGQVNMKTLLERLDQRMVDEQGFMVTVRFVISLNSWENAWTLGDPDDPRHRYINEIGDDYVCFKEKAGGTDGIRCTPFSNIAGVSYLTE